MAAIRDALVVSPIDGTAYQGVVDDATTPLGIYVELNGVAVAVDSGCTCTVRKGSTTLALTVSVATTGEATTSLTSGNIDTLGATMLDGLVASWVGAVTSGGVVYNFRYEMPLIITDRELRFPVLYAELKKQLPQLLNAATIPSTQTNLWPQCIIALRKLRNDINRKQGGVKDHLLTNPAEVKELAEEACLAALCRYMGGGDNRQSNLMLEAERHEGEVRRLFSEIAATVKTGSAAFGASDSRRLVQLQPSQSVGGGVVRGRGGPW